MVGSSVLIKRFIVALALITGCSTPIDKIKENNKMMFSETNQTLYRHCFRDYNETGAIICDFLDPAIINVNQYQPEVPEQE